MPLLFHPLDARWKQGHFRPMLLTAVIANIALALFYASYMKDLIAAGADGLAKLFIAVLSLEAGIISWYLVTADKPTKGHAVILKDGKTPTSIVSRIVARTIAIVSSAIILIAGRDFFFPGHILNFIPRDDIYLEWTNAFLHSPPEGSPEMEDNGMTAALYIGDKFVAQSMALHMLILCLYKIVASFFVRYGSDGGGAVKSRMIWKVQAISGALVLTLFRLFSLAAGSASLDLRWHLMMLAYETFILGLYGFF